MSRVISTRGFRSQIASQRALHKHSTYGNAFPFTTSANRQSYADTIHNLKIGKHTRVLYQGFTGRQATMNAKESLDWGTNIVGGVKPGFEGEHLGLPVLPSVRVAVEKLKPDASAIYVPGDGTVAALEEAIENEIPLIVAVAEHIPLHDTLRIHEMLRTQSKTRLVGANCPGIINVQGRCRLGFQPLPFFTEGRVGIVAKSGTLSYEAVASTTRAGLGQTYCISMGGDVLAGTNFVEAFQVLVEDEYTEGIIMIGELGGSAELRAAEWINNYNRRIANPKPFMALIGGIQAPPGRIMGHAGAWAAPGEASAAQKIKILEDVGVTVVDHPEKLGAGMKTLLAERTWAGTQDRTAAGAGQRRGYHTAPRRPKAFDPGKSVVEQRRRLYIKQSQAFDMLNARGVPTVVSPTIHEEKFIAISIDREMRQPCIIASPTTDPSQAFQLSRKFPFAYGTDAPTSPDMLEKVSSHLGVSGKCQPALGKLIAGLVDLFMSKEAFVLQTKVVMGEEGTLQVQGAKFGFDDAAFRSSKRQADIHALRDFQSEVPEEVEAENEGMIYVKLAGEGSIGTIVNGAGLAMNTVDALVARGGHPANFMDTGGKATSETIKAGFRIVTSDPRVKCIFVNIFGGLTLGDMIANGILMAFRDLDLKVPVVVRIRGTREAEGQKLIRDSGLKLDAFGRSSRIANSLQSLSLWLTDVLETRLL
ncbi:succinyl-CoA synthetase alpha subunit [Capronia epimyces CBS 606.96]|uniref:Succinyl-CoA synthetase alpha subunit n=1 Tax=Capronia epimyces CBS 606.96 TaxID=1182542 RepID=W9Y4P3_9EURO|nr:succinyl-CoA synthetase alpha subunit [Capronia epimyces CBS 606.96]EXJ77409.1 succinyl-CoA synthetase alpha subunit [Capronia epimyces CBS 606.96]